MSDKDAEGKQTLAPLLLGGVAGSMLGYITAKGERVMSERGHVITGTIIGTLLGGLILYNAGKLRKEQT